MVCIAEKPGNATFDVRCYHESFIPAVYRAVQLGYSVSGPKVEAEIKAGKLQITNQPTAGYRCLGPASGYDPTTNSVSSQIRCWQSIHYSASFLALHTFSAAAFLPAMRPPTMQRAMPCSLNPPADSPAQ